MDDKPCGYSGLGITSSNVPNDRVFGARCGCGAHVTVVDGRIPFHVPGADERPPDEPCEPAATTQEGAEIERNCGCLWYGKSRVSACSEHIADAKWTRP